VDYTLLYYRSFSFQLSYVLLRIILGYITSIPIVIFHNWCEWKPIGRPPQPPKRDPRTTLSVGRARARSMVAGLTEMGTSHIKCILASVDHGLYRFFLYSHIKCIQFCRVGCINLAWNLTIFLSCVWTTFHGIKLIISLFQNRTGRALVAARKSTTRIWQRLRRRRGRRRSVRVRVRVACPAPTWSGSRRRRRWRRRRRRRRRSLRRRHRRRRSRRRRRRRPRRRRVSTPASPKWNAWKWVHPSSSSSVLFVSTKSSITISQNFAFIRNIS